jgi:hypothetical protein
MTKPEFFSRIETNYKFSSAWDCYTHTSNESISIYLSGNLGAQWVNIYCTTIDPSSGPIITLYFGAVTNIKGQPMSWHTDVEEVIDILNLPAPELEAYLTAIHRQKIT